VPKINPNLVHTIEPIPVFRRAEVLIPFKHKYEPPAEEPTPKRPRQEDHPQPTEDLQGNFYSIFTQ
jgi:hypothetical protein